MGDAIELYIAGETRLFLAGSVVTLGRGDDADVVLHNPNVSRRHGELREVNGTWVFHDLGSAQGTFHGGERVSSLTIAGRVELTLGRPQVGETVGMRTISERERSQEATAMPPGFGGRSDAWFRPTPVDQARESPSQTPWPPFVETRRSELWRR